MPSILPSQHPLNSSFALDSVAVTQKADWVGPYEIWTEDLPESRLLVCITEFDEWVLFHQNDYQAGWERADGVASDKTHERTVTHFGLYRHGWSGFDYR